MGVCTTHQKEDHWIGADELYDSRDETVLQSYVTISSSPFLSLVAVTLS